MTHSTHLTEAERQEAADGSLPDDATARISAHLSACTECKDDVARLRALMTRMRETSPPPANLDGLWPDIRARIEQTKVVTLGPAASAAATDGHAWRRRVARAGPWIVAAVMIIAVATLLERRATHGRNATNAMPPSTDVRFATDSIAAYREEATRLLDQLELQRSLMRPSTRTQVDDDLRTIDQAIAEVEQAIARDPSNPALRPLLASSYRQKIELLERLGNAG